MNENYRGWYYKTHGDYHKNLDPKWSYLPTYLRKMQLVRQAIDNSSKESRILDIACGEGILVEEYSKKGYDIRGLDLNYESEYVMRGNMLHLPFKNESLDLCLFLDAIEHLDYKNQIPTLKEIQRVLKKGGKIIITIPNVAHLNSRLRFLFKGNLHRTDIIENHCGERPINEFIELINQAGFKTKKRIAITLTIPFIYNRIICRYPNKTIFLHNILDKLQLKELSFLNYFELEN